MVCQCPECEALSASIEALTARVEARIASFRESVNAIRAECRRFHKEAMEALQASPPSLAS